MRKSLSTNALNESFLYQTCELNSALTLISGRWKGQILYSISCGNNRFSRIKLALPNISDQMLGRQIKELEQHGIIVKQIIKKKPPSIIEYSLTQKGEAVVPILKQLCEWGQRFATWGLRHVKDDEKISTIR